MESINIRIASNGYIVTYIGGDNVDFLTEEFIAFDITNVCSTIEKLLRNEVAYGYDMSSIAINSMTDA